MKFKILRICVLLVSVSAASVLVWYATQNNKLDQEKNKTTISPEEMQGSSKSKVIVGADKIREMSQDEAEGFIRDIEANNGPTVTDEEVKRTRDMMMSTSKSGRIISDDDIRKMLEEQKKAESEIESKLRLMPSSKSIAPILEPEDVKKIVEDKTPEK